MRGALFFPPNFVNSLGAYIFVVYMKYLFPSKAYHLGGHEEGGAADGSRRPPTDVPALLRPLHDVFGSPDHLRRHE